METEKVAYRPPIKCLPLKNLTSGFGAVRLTRTSGLKALPTPDFGGPSSIFHDEGASTEVTGTVVSDMAWITAGNGSRTSPEKLKPGRDGQSRHRKAQCDNIPTKDGVNNMVGRLQRRGKVVDERDVEIFKLFSQALHTNNQLE